MPPAVATRVRMALQHIVNDRDRLNTLSAGPYPVHEPECQVVWPSLLPLRRHGASDSVSANTFQRRSRPLHIESPSRFAYHSIPLYANESRRYPADSTPSSSCSLDAGQVCTATRTAGTGTKLRRESLIISWTSHARFCAASCLRWRAVLSPIR